MSRVSLFLMLLVASVDAVGHALPTPLVTGPLRVRGNLLLDVSGSNIELAGVNIPELYSSPETIDVIFKVIRRRWNLNAVRMPVSVATWTEQGEPYLLRVMNAVARANESGLAVVLVARENSALPTPAMLTFWRTWAERFKGNNRIIFDLFDKPSPDSIPGRSGAGRTPADWQFWLNGGTTTSGAAAAGMEQLVQAVRSTGATQVIAAQAFNDANGFDRFESTYWLRDPNIIYEIHPSLDGDRERTYGFLTSRLHIYAGEWGVNLQRDTPACRALPLDVRAVTILLDNTLRYFFDKRISWTASSFEPGSLVTELETFKNTKLENLWQCGEGSGPAQGAGELILLWMTGDPAGFGQLLPELIANAATSRLGPVAPGEILSIYGEEIGPYPGVPAELHENGRLPTVIRTVRVLFDGVPAPLYFASSYQVNVQVPYSVAGKATTVMQLFYDGMPTSKLAMPVAEASPGIFADFAKEAKALNQDGSVNSTNSPANPGSIVVLFATGAGVLSPQRPEGHPAVVPLAAPVLPVSVRIDSAPVEVLYAGEAPGLIGVTQINVRLPEGPANSRAVTRQVDLTVGPYSNAAFATIWVR